MAIELSNAIVAGEHFFVQLKVRRAAIPRLLRQLAQMRFGAVEMDEREIGTQIPG